MVSLRDQTHDEPTLKVGIGGNRYVICNTREPLVELCEVFGKSVKSIYFNKKYGCFAIRVKQRTLKQALTDYFK